MAELADLKAIEARLNKGGGPSTSEVKNMLAELAIGRARAESDLRFMEERIAEVSSLKRRITELRDAISWGADTFSSDGLAAALKEDTATRRRFEKKQRKAARRG